MLVFQSGKLFITLKLRKRVNGIWPYQLIRYLSKLHTVTLNDLSMFISNFTNKLVKQSLRVTVCM